MSDISVVGGDFMVAADLVSNAEYIRKHAISADIGTSFETVTNLAVTPTPLTAAQNIDVVSGSANDAAAGTGARTIRVYGLDSNYNSIQEDFTMNGTTAVPAVTNTSWIAVNKIEILTTGSGNASAGAINVQGVTDNNILLNVAAGEKENADCVYTVPANSVLYIRKWGLSNFVQATTTNIQARLKITDPDKGIYVPDMFSATLNEGHPHRDNYIKVPAKNRVELQALAGTTAADVAAFFEGILYGDANVGTVVTVN